MPKTIREPRFYRKRKQTNTEENAWLHQRRDDLAIAQLPLDLRVINAIESKGILDVKTLIQLPLNEIQSIPNFGAKTLRQLIRAIKNRGLSPPGDWTSTKRKLRNKFELST